MLLYLTGTWLYCKSTHFMFAWWSYMCTDVCWAWRHFTWFAWLGKCCTSKTIISFVRKSFYPQDNHFSDKAVIIAFILQNIIYLIVKSIPKMNIFNNNFYWRTSLIKDVQSVEFLIRIWKNLILTWIPGVPNVSF